MVEGLNKLHQQYVQSNLCDINIPSDYKNNPAQTK
jgi:hypothetical protein